jgi:hypothetical protein
MMSLLILFVAAGCAKTIEFVPPPLQDPPQLKSFTVDQNDKTGEKGFWMNRGDADDLAIFFGHIHNVKDKWK